MNTLSKILQALVILTAGIQVVLFFSPRFPLWVQNYYYDIWMGDAYIALAITAMLVFFKIRDKLNIPLYPLILIINIATWLIPIGIVFALRDAFKGLD